LQNATRHVSSLRQGAFFRRARLLKRRPNGISVTPFEQGEIGADPFSATRSDIVSKRADRPYRAGRSKDLVKVKNGEHPAYRRVRIGSRRSRPRLSRPGVDFLGVTNRPARQPLRAR
jgi:hypothetical protein